MVGCVTRRCKNCGAALEDYRPVDYCVDCVCKMVTEHQQTLEKRGVNKTAREVECENERALKLIDRRSSANERSAFSPARKRRTSNKYRGLTRSQIEAMENEQSNRCAICGEMQPKTVSRERKLFIDHDHETGCVRGLLCHHCNVGLGFMKDDIQRLLSAVEYLKNSRTYQ